MATAYPPETETTSTAPAAPQPWYIRFHLAQRIEHFLLILSFTTLALTGLPQKFPLSPISRGFVDLVGGVENLRIIHRAAATLFLLEAIYHVVYIAYILYVRRAKPSMLPTMTDVRNAFEAIRYNLGLSNKKPEMPRYNFTEKMEYWAVVWGLVIMAITGFMMWNPIMTTRFLPGVVVPAAKAAHGGEAILAVLAIIIWHFYHVHIRHFNKSMFTGKISRTLMEEEHALELKEIETGKTPPPPSPEEYRRRMRVFVPIAAVMSILMLVLVGCFVTGENTAVAPTDAVPPAQETPAPAETGSVATEPAATEPAAELPEDLTWAANVGQIFQDRCALCHGSSGGYSVETYADAMTEVTPGDPDGSLALRIGSSPSHPGTFDADEVELIRAWIENGAPEE